MKDQQIRDALKPVFGCYAEWLIKYGKGLDKSDPTVIRMMTAYELYHRRPEHCSAAIIMNEIDRYCEETG